MESTTDQIEPEVFDVPHRLKVLTCKQCGMVFALPIDAHAEREKEGGQIFCPNGHAIRFTPPGGAPTVDEKELKRRINLLSIHADRAEYGRPICRFCGTKQTSNYNYKRHLKLKHSDEITELPAAIFRADGVRMPVGW